MPKILSVEAIPLKLPLWPRPKSRKVSKGLSKKKDVAAKSKQKTKFEKRFFTIKKRHFIIRFDLAACGYMNQNE